ncbi:helix-turn-helix domain-containing protein [Nonomuraea sp. NPDC005650]|uniref:helix-turn-helix domain-containing protein n=1 Tax=Nonomuraea sp. NPDC005650 TaxID=3157045 RepID=UPI0033AB746F
MNQLGRARSELCSEVFEAVWHHAIPYDDLTLALIIIQRTGGARNPGRPLRRLRRDARLRGRELGRLAGWHASKVSRIEHVHRPSSTHDVRAWCRHCGVPEQPRTSSPPWRQRGHARRMAAYGTHRAPPRTRVGSSRSGSVCAGSASTPQPHTRPAPDTRLHHCRAGRAPTAPRPP